jgi:hypothetical protein
VAELTIEKSGPELFGFQLNSPDGSVTKLQFKKDGTSTRTISAKGLYLLDWVVRGPQGKEFSYKVDLDGTVVEELKKARISRAQWEAGYIPVAVK